MKNLMENKSKILKVTFLATMLLTGEKTWGTDTNSMPFNNMGGDKGTTIELKEKIVNEENPDNGDTGCNCCANCCKSCKSKSGTPIEPIEKVDNEPLKESNLFNNNFGQNTTTQTSTNSTQFDK